MLGVTRTVVAPHHRFMPSTSKRPPSRHRAAGAPHGPRPRFGDRVAWTGAAAGTEGRSWEDGGVAPKMNYWLGSAGSACLSQPGNCY